MLTPEEIEKIKSYKELDTMQRILVSMLVNEVQYEEGPCHKATKHYEEEEIEEWENAHDVKLPEDYKWFLLNIGTYYPFYSMGDIVSNEDFSMPLLPDPDYPGEMEVNDYFYHLGCDGCTFSWILGLHDVDYGKVYSINWDSIYDFWDTSNEEAVKEEIRDALECSTVYDSFLEFYKDMLLNYYHKNCVEAQANIAEKILTYIENNTDANWIINADHKIFGYDREWVGQEFGNRIYSTVFDHLNVDDRRNLHTFVLFLMGTFELKNNKFKFKGKRIKRDDMLIIWYLHRAELLNDTKLQGFIDKTL